MPKSTGKPDQGWEKALRVNLSKELTDFWEEIKKFYGPESDADMLRFLIKKEVREIKKKKKELENNI